MSTTIKLFLPNANNVEDLPRLNEEGTSTVCRILAEGGRIFEGQGKGLEVVRMFQGKAVICADTHGDVMVILHAVSKLQSLSNLTSVNENSLVESSSSSNLSSLIISSVDEENVNKNKRSDKRSSPALFFLGDFLDRGCQSILW